MEGAQSSFGPQEMEGKQAITAPVMATATAYTPFL